MDFCQELPVAGEYRPLCSSMFSVDDLITGQNMECDISLEWLSTLVEDSLYSSGHKLPPTPHTPDGTTINTGNASVSEEPISKTLKESHKPGQENPISLQSHVSAAAPGETRKRTKRKRARVTKNPLALWSHQLNPHGCLTSCSTDPPLLQQEHWLADSELIVPKRDEDAFKEGKDPSGKKEAQEHSHQHASIVEPVKIFGDEGQKQEVEEEGQKRKKGEGLNASRKENDQNPLGGVQMRRCSHCMAHKTPQWRAGPLGPKTLCNACGVRYKTGRLLPEYRPAKSPTFVSFLHSNSHKKVLEMRMGLEASSVSSIEQ